MKMKNILILIALFTLSSVNAKETTFDLKKGVLDAKCIHVSNGLGNYHAWLEQRGKSSNFELKHAIPAKEGDCPLILDEGDYCEIIEDISDTVEVTGEGCEEDVCTTTKVIEGTVINRSCKKEGDSCFFDGRQGMVKDGECIDFVS